MIEDVPIPLTDEDLYGEERNVEEPVEQFIPFRLGAEWYSVSITKIREVLRAGQITYLPSAPSHIAGIINRRGNILSVTDPKRLFGVPPSPRTEQNRIVVVEAQGTETGLLVDEVEEVVAVPLSHLESPLSTLDPERAAYLEHTCRSGERLMAILRVEKLLGMADASQSSAQRGG